MSNIAPYNPTGMVANIPGNLIVNKNNYEIFLSDSYNKFFQGSKWSGKSRHGAIEAIFELVNFPNRNVVVMKKVRGGKAGHHNKTFKDILEIIDQIDGYVNGFKKLGKIVDKDDDTFSIAYIGNWSDPKKQEVYFCSMEYDSTAGLKTGYADVFYTKLGAEEIVDGDDDGMVEKGFSSKYLEFSYFQRLQSNIFRFTEQEKEKYNLRAQTIFTFNPGSMGHGLYLENAKYIDFYSDKILKKLKTKGSGNKVIDEYGYNEISQEGTSAFYQINNGRTLLAENNQHGIQFISDDIIASITGVEDPSSARVLNYGLPSIPKGTILQGVLHKLKVEHIDFTPLMCVSIGIDIGGTDPYSLHFHGTTRHSAKTSDNKVMYTNEPTGKKLIIAHEGYYDPLKSPISLSEQQIAEGIVNHIMTIDFNTKKNFGRSIFDNNIGQVLIKIDNNNQEFVDGLRLVITVKGLEERLIISPANNKNELDHLIPQRNTDINLIIGADKYYMDNNTTKNIRQHMPSGKMSPTGNNKMVHTFKHTYDSQYYAGMDFKSYYLPELHKTIDPNIPN